MALRTETLRYEAAGVSMLSHLAWDDARVEARPGVLVFPEALGLGDHARGRAERLARDCGYAALACDLHGEGRLYSNVQDALPFLQVLQSDPSLMRDHVAKSLAALRARSHVDGGRLAAMGYCFGGTMALELAATGADIKAAIGFHSRLILGNLVASMKMSAKILVLIGADDPMIPSEMRADFEEAMRGANADWQMHLYGGVVHSFTNPEADSRGIPSQRYDPAADARSWRLMAAHLEEAFH